MMKNPDLWTKPKNTLFLLYISLGTRLSIWIDEIWCQLLNYNVFGGQCFERTNETLLTKIILSTIIIMPKIQLLAIFPITLLRRLVIVFSWDVNDQRIGKLSSWLPPATLGEIINVGFFREVAGGKGREYYKRNKENTRICPSWP